MDLITHSEIVPAVNQIETHPFYQREEERVLHKEYGILQQSWASFAEGKNKIFSNPVLTEIAQTHHKSVAQVILRWLNQREVAVIPKSITHSRIVENIDIFDFTLNLKEMAKIATIEQGKSLFFNHRDPAIVKWLGNLAV